MGAEVVVGIDPEPEDAPVRVERHLGRRPLVPRMGVGRHPLAPLRDPLDRPVEPPGGPEDQRVLREHPAFHPETAADVARDHRDAGFGDAEHALGEKLADPVRVLATQMEPVAAVGGVVFAHRAARFHGHGGNPVVVEREGDHAVGGGEGGLRFRAVAHLDGEAIVVRGLRPDRGGPARLGGIDRHREVLVVDRHQLGDIQRPVASPGDDEGDRGADMPRGIQREGRGRRPPHRPGHDRVVDREARYRSETVGAVVLAGQHGEHARRRARHGRID